MKPILLALLLSTATMFSSQVVSNLVYSAPGVRIYVVTIISDTTNVVSQPITNQPAVNHQYKNVDVSLLEKRIQEEEKRIHDDYDGLNTSYAAPSSPQSTYALEKLQQMWKERDRAVHKLNELKEQLERLKKQKPYGLPR